MTIEDERRKLLALSLLPVVQLPAYSADFVVASRVGKVIAAPTMWPSDGPLPLSAPILAGG